MHQKLFGLGMLAVVILFIVASVAVPTFQALIAHGAHDLPFGLDGVRGLVYWVSFALGLVVLFVALCITYFAVPKGVIPWSCVWPGALGATLAMGVVDLAFPVYLANASTLRIGTSAVFVLIALVWFYALAIILLAGAVVNDLRYARVSPTRLRLSARERAVRRHGALPRAALTPAARRPFSRPRAGRCDVAGGGNGTGPCPRSQQPCGFAPSDRRSEANRPQVAFKNPNPPADRDLEPDPGSLPRLRCGFPLPTFTRSPPPSRWPADRPRRARRQRREHGAEPAVGHLDARRARRGASGAASSARSSPC